MRDVAWQPFAELIERGDVAGVVAALEGLEEAERRRLSAHARRTAKAFETDGRWLSGTRTNWERDRSKFDASDVAVFATAGPAAAASRTWWSVLRHPGAAERLVRSRPQRWRQEWAERVVDADSAPAAWRLVYGLVKDRLIDRPASPGYVILAVSGLRDAPGHRERLADTLRHESEWLSDELWRFFEIEDVNLTGTEQWLFDGAQPWQDALCELAADGTVPRDRLLDASLAALRRDFSAHSARWYHKFHEALEPTPEEHEARLDDLLALLASENPSVVAFSLRALSKLERAGRLPADRFLEAVGPAMLVTVKGHATRAAKLTGRVLKRAPETAALAAPALVDALAHDAREVQEAIVGVLEAHRAALSPETQLRLADLAVDVDPALRVRVAALGGQTADVPVHEGPAVALPERQPVPPDAPRLAGRAALAPVGDVDDLLERIAVLLENDDDPDELELVLDGISRLRVAPVDETRAHTLVVRAQEVATPWNRAISFNHAHDALAAVVVGWLAPTEDVRLAQTGRGPREAVALRVRELMGELAAGDAPRALLSTPTHSGGWIDPAEAVRRVAQLERRRPPVMDLAQMALRLAPDDRETARADALRLRGEAAGVLARALGADVRRPLLTRLKPAWEAAEHARDPAAFVIPARPLDDLDAMRAAWYPRRAPKVDPASPADLLALEEAWWGWQEGGIERWLTTVWPANREPIFQVVVRRLWVDIGSRQYGIGDILETLLEPDEPVGPVATLAVALALGGADVTHRTLGADVTIATLRSRRLDGAALGTALARLLREQADAVPSRWATSLSDVAGAGPITAYDSQIAIETVLATATDSDPRRLLGLVELLRRLAIDADAGVTNPRARDWLENLPPRSKGGRAAREALAVSGNGATRTRAAAAELTVAHS